ncbi:SOUL heme-binding [Micractinium conductrix]|uniref:SOUL heme-binding n=1 Tax=Micractinium conductrix TaxID=554055 RepID=A0A2P6VFF4_9CHLO|nr:SOUL heme-binding [Micractinium conductrix]|eukprot:PSC72824.1 SOUL heme-binding [Micractinium conductrix]
MGALSVTLGTVGGIAGLAFVAWPIAIWWEVKKCEKPKYTLLRTLGQRRGWWGRVRPAADVRLYTPYLMAEVTMQGDNVDMQEALSGGFRQIAGFIFGKNMAPESGEKAKVAMTSPVTLEAPLTGGGGDSAKIAMTSPVTAEMGAGGTYKVSFIMPSQYSKETLPKPVNPSVEIHEKPARTMVALTWNGKSPREAEVAQRSSELRELMAGAGLTPKAGTSLHVWQYDPPFQWRWFRTNEVLYEVEGEEATSTS